MISLHLLLTAATFIQTPVGAPVPPVPLTAVAAVAPALAQARAALDIARAQVAPLSRVYPNMAMAYAGHARAYAALARDQARAARWATRAPVGEYTDDPGDSLYNAARSLLNRARYNEAASAFADLAKRYPKSRYAPDSYYWQAFSLYKTGDASKLKQARSVLEYQQQHFPDAATHGDADALYAQIQGALARQGDGPAGEWVQKHASQADAERPTTSGSCASSDDDDDDPRIAALNALLQMDADRAVPVLKKVLERRDPCSVSLRRKAIFIISQQHTAETEDILLGAARNDPDEDVREQAVFWLSQVGTAKATAALDSILLNSTNTELQDKAIFALSQIDSPEASKAIRDYAERPGAPVEARGKAIFWLSQQHDGANAAYLRALYGRLTDDDLKDKTIFAISQLGGADNTNWLVDLAANKQESVEMRKKALFWAGQSNEVSLDRLTGLYDRMDDRDMKEQMIFVYSQRHEGAALDKLIDIAKHDTDPELRKKAIFWIGQSHDPKAAQYLQEVISQ